jgi:cell division protein ZapA
MIMISESSQLDVKIMGREYRIACKPEEADALLAAVAFVDEQMQEIAGKTRNTMPERVAVMAALNIAHEHLSAKNQQAGFDTTAAKRRIEAMEARLDAALAQQQLEL